MWTACAREECAETRLLGHGCYSLSNKYADLLVVGSSGMLIKVSQSVRMVLFVANYVSLTLYK